ncbi:hypothetical protein GCK32_014341 [Trichostrongylus colubriformis]|uniref:Uncharacterized protein n=1 Tax=Trichostrongylus colubriformis TaxID=6319 RepID=A0AAN8GEB0_TRICO
MATPSSVFANPSDFTVKSRATLRGKDPRASEVIRGRIGWYRPVGLAVSEPESLTLLQVRPISNHEIMSDDGNRLPMGQTFYLARTCSNYYPEHTSTKLLPSRMTATNHSKMAYATVTVFVWARSSPPSPLRMIPSELQRCCYFLRAFFRHPSIVLCGPVRATAPVYSETYDSCNSKKIASIQRLLGF